MVAKQNNMVVLTQIMSDELTWGLIHMQMVQVITYSHITHFVMSVYIDMLQFNLCPRRARVCVCVCVCIVHGQAMSTLSTETKMSIDVESALN